MRLGQVVGQVLVARGPSYHPQLPLSHSVTDEMVTHVSMAFHCVTVSLAIPAAALLSMNSRE
jgi:hypothetical protein